MYESKRKSNEGLMSDIYDTPRWRQLMGEATVELSRIGVHLCVDGVPAHAKKDGETVKPIQLLVCSLPPWCRYQSQFMPVLALVPAHLKGTWCGRISQRN